MTLSTAAAGTTATPPRLHPASPGTVMPGEPEQPGRDEDAFTDLLAGAFGRVTHGAAVADLRDPGHQQRADAEIPGVVFS